MSGTADKTTAPAETLADALAAAHRMLDEDSWIDEVTALDEDGEPDDFAQRVVRANDMRDALGRIEAAAVRERERLRGLVIRLAQRLRATKLADPDPVGEDALLREAEYEIAGLPYAIADDQPVVCLHGRVAIDARTGREFPVHRPMLGEEART